MPRDYERDAPRRPDYEIKALDKETQERQKIGAAWLQDDGSVYLKFDRFVQVPVGKRYALTAFPVDEEGPYERPVGRGRVAVDDEPRAGRRIQAHRPARQTPRRPVRR